MRNTVTFGVEEYSRAELHYQTMVGRAPLVVKARLAARHVVVPHATVVRP